MYLSAVLYFCGYIPLSKNLGQLYITEYCTEKSLKLIKTWYFSGRRFSFNSSFINNLNNSVTDWVREGKVYKHNGGGVELLLQTHNGDIVISE